MSRSGYNDDIDPWQLIMWRGQVASAIRGSRGQKFFREMAAALDAMTDKALIAHALVKDGEHCALGVLGEARGISIADLDPEDAETVAAKFDIATCLAQETVYMNDEAMWTAETPAERWVRVRAWVGKQIKAAAP